MDISRTQCAAFEIAKLIEDEQRMIAGAGKMAVGFEPLGARQSQLTPAKAPPKGGKATPSPLPSATVSSPLGFGWATAALPPILARGAVWMR